MKIWKEHNNDIYDYFRVLKKLIRVNDNLQEINMSVFSINASEIYSYNDKKKFIKKCCDEIKILLKNCLKNYNIYLFVNVNVSNKNSKVENYIKAWKKINKKINIDGFILGKEIAIEKNDKLVYSSIAQIPVDYLYSALEIVSLNPSQNTIFMSKSSDILSEEYSRKLYSILFEDKNSDEINYYNLALNCCIKNDIAIRYGTSFTEAEIALVYNTKEIKI